MIKSIIRKLRYYLLLGICLLSVILIEPKLVAGQPQGFASHSPTNPVSIPNLPIATYYISSSGNDNNSGTSPSKAWQTVNRINRFTFRPGDRILFEGGATFRGGLSFDAGDRGMPTQPIFISSYGRGRATLDARDSNGIYIHNTGGYSIDNLNLVGSGWKHNRGSGINFYNDLSGDVKLEQIRINNVDVYGFGNHGIAVGSWNQKSGYRNIQISHVLTHNNGKSGLLTYAQIPNVHENVQIRYVRAYENLGIPGDDSPTGNGIVLGGVKAGIIERCIAHHNGELNDANSGPVGIWTYDSSNVAIQYNESYKNHTGRTKDGGGFDLDQNVSQSVIQYNYSHDNDGAGYLLAHGLINPAFTNNTIRYNISQNDGRKNDYAGIYLYGQIRNTEIYNNTVFVNAAPVGKPAAVRIGNLSVETLKLNGVRFYNNIFQTTDGLDLVDISASQVGGKKNLTFQGNNYYSTNKKFSIHWGDRIYINFSTWRRETGQEQLHSNPSGFSINPQLFEPGGGLIIGNPDLLSTLDAYRLRPTSPLIDAGLNLNTLFSLDTGEQDFYGTSLPQGKSYELGAYESMVNLLPQQSQRF
ncbi:right-handed parallel beta-helix repeat-containing protein [Altericista sp. CCNU0014]|uniref:right-handed parallel beta-helix repeat-containing protein n=1 Tax=Altericista sp. CCNU0014 TaxID=3082949 RepID=UPI00384B06EB